MDTISINNLVEVLGGRVAGVADLEAQVRAIRTDSRSVNPHDAFWALCGEHHDGHDFVNDLVQIAAISVVNESAHQQITGPRLLVENTLEALGKFAHWYRQQHDALVIGITGSVGKTTTRRMVHHALGQSYTGIQSPANYNNEIGVPLTLLQLSHDDEFAVVELGASRVGEIRPLAQMAEVEVGIITAVAPAHVEGFGSIERIVEAKSELVEVVPSTGFVVLAGDDPRVYSMQDRTSAPVILVGESEHNQIRARDVVVQPRQLKFTVGSQRYRIPVAGRHHLTSALAAIAVAEELGIRPAEIARQMATFTSTPGRCHVKQVGHWTVIDDTYNSNPGSLEAACRLLADWSGTNRTILVTADMLELGDLTLPEHYRAGQIAADSGIDHVVAIGQHAREVIRGAHDSGMRGDQLSECDDLDAVQLTLDCWLEPNSVVLVKGSRSTNMERVVEWIQRTSTASQRGTESGPRLPAVA